MIISSKNNKTNMWHWENPADSLVSSINAGTGEWHISFKTASRPHLFIVLLSERCWLYVVVLAKWWSWQNSFSYSSYQNQCTYWFRAQHDSASKWSTKPQKYLILVFGFTRSVGNNLRLLNKSLYIASEEFNANWKTKFTWFLFKISLFS